MSNSSMSNTQHYTHHTATTNFEDLSGSGSAYDPDQDMVDEIIEQPDTTEPSASNSRKRKAPSSSTPANGPSEQQHATQTNAPAVPSISSAPSAPSTSTVPAVSAPDAEIPATTALRKPGEPPKRVVGQQVQGFCTREKHGWLVIRSFYNPNTKKFGKLCEKCRETSIKDRFRRKHAKQQGLTMAQVKAQHGSYDNFAALHPYKGKVPPIMTAPAAATTAGAEDDVAEEPPAKRQKTSATTSRATANTMNEDDIDNEDNEVPSYTQARMPTRIGYPREQLTVAWMKAHFHEIPDNCLDLTDGYNRTFVKNCPYFSDMDTSTEVLELSLTLSARIIGLIFKMTNDIDWTMPTEARDFETLVAMLCNAYELGCVQEHDRLIDEMRAFLADSRNSTASKVFWKVYNTCGIDSTASQLITDWRFQWEHIQLAAEGDGLSWVRPKDIRPSKKNGLQTTIYRSAYWRADIEKSRSYLPTPLKNALSRLNNRTVAENWETRIFREGGALECCYRFHEHHNVDGVSCYKGLDEVPDPDPEPLGQLPPADAYHSMDELFLGRKSCSTDKEISKHALGSIKGMKKNVDTLCRDARVKAGQEVEDPEEETEEEGPETEEPEVADPEMNNTMEEDSSSSGDDSESDDSDTVMDDAPWRPRLMNW